MGSCVSINKSPDSVMKLRLSFGSKNDNIPPSPVKPKPAGAGDIRIKDVALAAWTPSPSARTLADNFGSKEEAFFDSKAWLDSDCDDDFFSVNGDFTPSRGSTPVNHVFVQVNKSPFEDRLPPNDTTIPTPSPTEKKKRLLELFKESVRDDEDQANHRNSTSTTPTPTTTVLDQLPPKSGRATPFISGVNSLCSSERTPNGTELPIYEIEKPMRSSQCCLPSLVSCRSFSERKKKMSPAIAVNGKT